MRTTPSMQGTRSAHRCQWGRPWKLPLGFAGDEVVGLVFGWSIIEREDWISSYDAPNCVSAQQCAVLVRAVRDEGGFNMRRTRQLREAWKALGNRDQAQVGHIGLPHVFVRAGEFTGMIPQLAVTNLREEKNEIFLRGVRIDARTQDASR